MATEEMSSRKRRPNWTDPECLFLAQLMQAKKDIIRGRCSTGVTTEDKRQAWEDITQAVNDSFPLIQRTITDCNKKWENMLAKSKDEIKRHKSHMGPEGLSLEMFSEVTQVVISMMDLSSMLQQDSKGTEFPYTEQNIFDDDGDHCTESDVKNAPLMEVVLPLCQDPPTSTVTKAKRKRRKAAFSLGPKKLSSRRPVVFDTLAIQRDAPCSTPAPSSCTCAKEREEMNMSVLRRQESVLMLQEEYYTLKINMLKKQIEERLSKD